MKFPKIPAAALDPKTNLYRVNHPIFLWYLLLCGMYYLVQEHNAYPWQLQFWTFLIKIFRQRHNANSLPKCSCDPCH